ncbi:MAG: redoxin domain-containing protein [Victivallales bacterium]|nr:redoxin domain-containing protein [Victivallales bacterium]
MKKLSLAVLLTATVFSAFSGLALQTGDKAVPLKVSQWLKNGPVLLNTGKKIPKNRQKNLFVLVLWGTWSPSCREAVPMLVYLQNKYRAEHLQIIAVSRETKTVIQKFLTEYPQINYTVAVDDHSLTTLNYLGESRLLPRLYIIDAENQILWDGEIADLATILKKIYNGTYDLNTQRQISHLQQEMEAALRSGSTKQTIELSDKILQLDPENGFAVRMRLFIYENNRQPDRAWDFLNSRLDKTPDNTMLYFIKLDFISRFPQYAQYAAGLADEIRQRFHSNAQMLNNMAWGLLTRFPFDGEVLKPAAECTRRALELTAADKADKALYASCLNTMALVYYRCGMIKKALTAQREVSRLAGGDNVKTNSSPAEKLYQAALELQNELSAGKK